MLWTIFFFSLTVETSSLRATKTVSVSGILALTHSPLLFKGSAETKGTRLLGKNWPCSYVCYFCHQIVFMVGSEFSADKLNVIVVNRWGGIGGDEDWGWRRGDPPAETLHQQEDVKQETSADIKASRTHSSGASCLFIYCFLFLVNILISHILM